MTDKRKVQVVEHMKAWKEAFKEESQQVKAVLKDLVLHTYHIGSTAIPGIKAKPVIDILVEVKDIEKVDQYNQAMAQLGYEAMGENGIENRRFFRKGGNNRTHHVHVFQTENEEIERHLNFRDYMIAHPDEAKVYSDLKEELARKYTYDIGGYIDGKNDFIKAIDRKAGKWAKNR